MAVSDPRIFVVASADEAQGITLLLMQAGFTKIRSGDGGDETLGEILGDPPDVVVLRASLEHGDALSLSNTLRTALDRPRPVVLIGDDQGPIRTALDALDYAAERFLRWPVHPNALAYSIRSVQGGAAEGAQATGGLAEGLVSAGLAEASDGEIAAISAGLAEIAASSATSAIDQQPWEADRQQPWEADRQQPWEADRQQPGEADRAAGVAQHALQARLDAAISDAIDTLIHDVIDDALATATLAVRSEAQVAEAKAHDSLPTSSTSPMSSLDEAWELDAPPPLPDPVPAWREPTQIISGSEPPSTATAREELPEPREPETAGSMYVAELRRTMSAIEQRLFGRRAGEAAVDSLRAQEPQELEMPSDIDLDSLGVDTHPGLGASPVRIPRGRTPPPLIEDDVVVEDVEHELQRRGAGRAFGPTHGDLADEDAAMLLSRLFRESWSGRITFRHEGTEKAVFLESGRPVFATSNHPVDRMGDLLFREGKITREQYAKSTEIVVGTGRRMGEILVEMGFLKRRELLPAVRRHVEDIIYSVFGWEAGQFQLIAGDMAQDEKIRLTKHPTALVMEGVRRKISGERILNRLGGQSAVLLPLKSRVEMLSALADAELTAEEQHALELFDGTRSIEGIVSVAILPEDSVFQLAHGLLALGLARRVDRARDAESLTPSPTPSGSGTADARIDRERVLAKHALVEEADYCTVLGVRRDASAFEIRRAYEAARRDYSLPTFPVEVQRELAEPLREIAVVLDEAYRVLHDDDIRAQYLHHLKD